MCSEFLRPEKIHRLQADLNPRTLDFEASTLSRDHRSRLIIELVMQIFNYRLFSYFIITQLFSYPVSYLHNLLIIQLYNQIVTKLVTH